MVIKVSDFPVNLRLVIDTGVPSHSVTLPDMADANSISRSTELFWSLLTTMRWIGLAYPFPIAWMEKFP